MRGIEATRWMSRGHEESVGAFDDVSLRRLQLLGHPFPFRGAPLRQARFQLDCPSLNVLWAICETLMHLDGQEGWGRCGQMSVDPESTASGELDDEYADLMVDCDVFPDW